MNIALDHNKLKRDGSPLPLCVDLDGTLIRTDLLHEAVFMLLKINFFYVFLLPVWALKGKAYLKCKIAERVQPNAESLPYNEVLLDRLKAEKANGRELVLATASHQDYAASVAEHLSIFDSIEATGDGTNLSGQRKADRLNERFGYQGFDYVGNSADDIKVWDNANHAIIVGNERAAVSYCQKKDSERLLEPSNGSFFSKAKVWLKAIRVHQWLKNSLLFVPAILASKFFDGQTVTELFLAFFSFSFCASSVYLLNDLIDIDVDRRHKTKRNRPLAAGKITVFNAAVVGTVLMVASLALSLLLPPLFTAALILYLTVTTAYSLLLKRLLLIDVLTLAGLFTLRIMAGAAAVGGTVSTWLLAFSVFFFLSLALVKRFVELSNQLGGNSKKTSGRGYQVGDLETLGQAGMTSGFASVVVLALFIDSPTIAENYSNPTLIWLVCPLVLYILMRIWILARRNEMHDDPVLFLMTDWRSQIMIAAGAVIMVLSQVF